MYLHSRFPALLETYPVYGRLCTFEFSLDALNLRSDVISPKTILHLQPVQDEIVEVLESDLHGDERRDVPHDHEHLRPEAVAAQRFGPRNLPYTEGTTYKVVKTFTVKPRP